MVGQFRVTSASMATCGFHPTTPLRQALRLPSSRTAGQVASRLGYLLPPRTVAPYRVAANTTALARTSKYGLVTSASACRSGRRLALPDASMSVLGHPPT